MPCRRATAADRQAAGVDGVTYRACMRTRNAVAVLVAAVLSTAVLAPGAARSASSERQEPAVTRIHWVDPVGDAHVRHAHPVPAGARKKADLHETTFRVIRTGDRPVLRVDLRVGGYVDLPHVRQWFVVRAADYLVEIWTTTKRERPRLGIDNGRSYSHKRCGA